ncbi:hypothetical protein BV378_02990 [Nostoc sp. RF31YmG]|jgi:hypothetical protein|nr:hypothetical protein BV378_02990 [Nostoc sp. RF31YmG]
METTTQKKSLLELINEYLQAAPESTLEKVLELLEDEEDIRDARADLEDIKINGGIPWEEIKRDMKKDIV